MNLIYYSSKFDTLESVASKFFVSADQLKVLNNLTNNNLPSILKIPQSKDDCFVIANLKREYVYFGNAESVKKQLNNIGLYCENPHMSINLFKPKNEDVYVVNVLDNLDKICNKFNLNKTEVVLKNNLKTEKLFIGQILKL